MKVRERMTEHLSEPVVKPSTSAPRGLFALIAVLLLVGWLLKTPGGLLGKADAVGYAVCHRIEVRSFHLGERQLPLCARCSGMYLGAMLGLAFLVLTAKRRGGMPHWSVFIVLGILVVAFCLDGFNSWLHLFPGAPGLYEPMNWLRLATGTGMGLAVAGVIYPAFNQTVWRQWDRKPVVKNLVTLLPVFLLAGLVDLLVLSENPLVLYPLALISALGVLVLLTSVYSMLWLIITHKENSLHQRSQLLTPLLAGFSMALLQIILLDLARYWLTGTWAGFTFG